MHFDILLGTLAICFGTYMGYVRIQHPQRSTRLQRMRATLGDRPGTIAHTVAYSVLPILFGIVLIVGQLLMPTPAA